MAKVICFLSQLTKHRPKPPPRGLDTSRLSSLGQSGGWCTHHVPLYQDASIKGADPYGGCRMQAPCLSVLTGCTHTLSAVAILVWCVRREKIGAVSATRLPRSLIWSQEEGPSSGVNREADATGWPLVTVLHIGVYRSCTGHVQTMQCRSVP